MSTSRPNLPQLTGADHFILALEKQDQNVLSSGNTCRYILDFDGIIDAQTLRNQLDKEALVRELSSYCLADTFWSKKWIQKDNSTIAVSETYTEEAFPQELLPHQLNKTSPPLLRFDILVRSNQTCRIILSWHHLLMDGYGVVLLLKSLANSLKSKDSLFEPPIRIKRSLKKAIQAKALVSNSSKGKISAILQSVSSSSRQQIECISFTKEESLHLKENGQKAGSKFGPSPFLLACLAVSLKGTLTQRGEKNCNFWIPVPQDTRKKGADSPIIGNHLSFLFYRLFDTALTSPKTAVSSITQQMVEQIKQEDPTSYLHLMEYMKLFPTPIYHHFIKGPQGQSLSSFLFTMAAAHPPEIKELFGLKITNAFSLPPNTYPPGLTFAVTHFEEKMRLSILYYEDVLSSKEIEQLIANIKSALLGPY